MWEWQKGGGREHGREEGGFQECTERWKKIQGRKELNASPKGGEVMLPTGHEGP